nr:tRNA methyl transferase PRC-barrel domain-containing protein [Mycoplasmopsis bovis]
MQPGDIVDIRTNKKLGEHEGCFYYTIGQRKGLNLGGQAEPYYVCGHDVKKNILYVAPKQWFKLFNFWCSISNRAYP